MKLNLTAFLIGGVLCTGATQAQGTIWTVDDDGPADFSQIADAIASPSVVDGDVLQVYSGNYANFVLDKSLSIVAKTGFSTGWCEVTDVEEFSISGMWAKEHLTAKNVSGRGRFDDCSIGEFVGYCATPDEWLIDGWARFTDCSDLVVTRCGLFGTDGCEYADALALEITNSTVAIVDSDLYGGWGFKFGGTQALGVWGQSDVTIAGSTLLAQSWGWPIGAIVVGPDSVVRIRGSTDDRVEGSSYGFAVEADPAATVTVSGVALYPARPGEWVTWVDPPEPYLSVSGTDDPGGMKSVELYGPPGRLGLVLFSLVPALHVMAEDLDPLWLDPASLLMVVPLTTIDQETASSYSVYLPDDPALAGIALTLQTWFPPIPQQRNFLTNPANIVLRW